MRSNSKPVTQRQLRVAEQIRHILADCFQRGNVPDDFLDCPPVSVMEVRVSPDFSFCKIRLRLTPEIRFYADGAQAEADKIEMLLASEAVQRDLAAREDGQDDAGNADD